jgi:hypothetical protein
MKFGVRDDEFSDFLRMIKKSEFLQSNPNLDHRISKYLGLRRLKFGFPAKI